MTATNLQINPHLMSTPGVLAAMEAAVQFLENEFFAQFAEKPQITWLPRPEDPNQHWIVARFELMENSFLALDEVKAWAHRSEIPLNKILEGEGVSIRLQPIINGFGVVIVLDATAHYLLEGIRNDSTGKQYQIHGKPAYLLDKPNHGVEFWTVPDHGSENPLIVIPTTTGDYIFVIREDTPVEGTSLDQYFETLQRHQWVPEYKYGGVILPNALLNDKPDISWLIGLVAAAAPDSDGNLLVLATVSQALMEVSFAFSPLGVRGRAVVAMALSRSNHVELPNHVVDYPFVFGLYRPEYGMLFSGWVHPESFSNTEINLSDLDPSSQTTTVDTESQQLWDNLVAFMKNHPSIVGFEVEIAGEKGEAYVTLGFEQEFTGMYLEINGQSHQVLAGRAIDSISLPWSDLLKVLDEQVRREVKLY